MTTKQHKYLIGLVKELVMSTTPFPSALEGGDQGDLEKLHDKLREAVGISYHEWLESEMRA